MLKEKKYYLTPEGLEKLKGKHGRLKGKALPEVIRKLQKAQEEEPELFENVAYNEALKEKDQIERKIAELDGVLKNYELIEKGPRNEVGLGSIVIVEVEGEKDEFTIVGSLEADPTVGKISDESPVGKALLGTKPGAVIEVTGSIVRSTYKVLEIK